MALVVDSSAIIALALHDEDARYADAVILRIAREGAAVPMLFWYEVRNVLLQAERKNRISQAGVDSFLADFNQVALIVDTTPQETQVMNLARRHGLTSYDASYLELAKRHNATLATLDNKLRTASEAEAVSFMPDL